MATSAKTSHSGGKEGSGLPPPPVPKGGRTTREATREKGKEKEMEDRIMAKLAMMFEQWAKIQGGPLTKGRKDTGADAAPAPTKGHNKRKEAGKSSPPGKNIKSNKPTGQGEIQTAGSGDRSGLKKNRTTTTTTEDPTPWTMVLGRKSKGKEGGIAEVKMPLNRGPQKTQTAGAESTRKQNENYPPKQTVGPREDRGNNAGKRKKKRKRPPRSAAVVITCPEGQYGEIMRTAREGIDLADLGIEAIRPKRALTGALILEVPGEEGSSRADLLADRMRGVLANREGVRISRPRKMGEIRIKGLDDSVTKADILKTVSGADGCKMEEIQMGDLTRSTGGLFAAWVKCPIEGAIKLANEGSVKIGWSKARIEALEERPLQCFKCLRRGHVRAQCPNDEDRTGTCYRCGLEGHNAKGCTRQPECALCKAAGRRANHRLGGKACNAPPPKKKKTGKEAARTTGGGPTGHYSGHPAPPPCALEGPRQPPQWDYVIPPLPCAKLGEEEEPKERRPLKPRIVAMEVVAPPRKEDERKGGQEEPMDTEAVDGH